MRGCRDYTLYKMGRGRWQKDRSKSGRKKNGKVKGKEETDYLVVAIRYVLEAK